MVYESGDYGHEDSHGDQPPLPPEQYGRPSPSDITPTHGVPPYRGHWSDIPLARPNYERDWTQEHQIKRPAPNPTPGIPAPPSEPDILSDEGPEIRSHRNLGADRTRNRIIAAATAAALLAGGAAADQATGHHVRDKLVEIGKEVGHKITG